MLERFDDSRSIGKSVAEQVDFVSDGSALDHATTRCHIRESVGFCVPNQNLGRMRKLRKAFFNYLRNRCL